MRRRRARTRYKLKPVPVQDFMDRNNRTQRQMADLIGISDAYFSQILNGDRSPSARVRAGLQRVMGVEDIDELFTIVAHSCQSRRMLPYRYVIDVTIL